jgi:hypothetical protein
MCRLNEEWIKPLAGHNIYILKSKYEEEKIAYEEFDRKWWRIFAYGYRGPEDGFREWINTKQQKQQGSNKQGCIPLKDSGEVLKGTRHPALLRKQEADNLLQDTPMRVSGKRTQSFNLWVIEDRVRGKAYKDWCSLHSPNKG